LTTAIEIRQDEKDPACFVIFFPSRSSLSLQAKSVAETNDWISKFTPIIKIYGKTNVGNRESRYKKILLLLTFRASLILLEVPDQIETPETDDLEADLSPSSSAQV
jgi:hypothetical protein